MKHFDYHCDENIRLYFTLRCLPGIGRRRAENMILNLQQLSDEQLQRLAEAIYDLKGNDRTCTICGCLYNVKIHDQCSKCQNVLWQNPEGDIFLSTPEAMQRVQENHFAQKVSAIFNSKIIDAREKWAKG